MPELPVEVAESQFAVSIPSTPPRRVKLLPIGTVRMRDGRGPYIVRDQAHAVRIIQATRAWFGSSDMMFDYDHQAIFAVGPTRGGTAIAAGWAATSSLSAEPDGIYVGVEWTPPAAQKIAAREYRYLSPAFLAAKGTGEILQIKNAALVNFAAIDSMDIVAASSMNNGASSSALSAEEIWVCERLGISHASFLAAKQEETGNA